MEVLFPPAFERNFNSLSNTRRRRACKVSLISLRFAFVHLSSCLRFSTCLSTWLFIQLFYLHSAVYLLFPLPICTCDCLSVILSIYLVSHFLFIYFLFTSVLLSPFLSIICSSIILFISLYLSLSMFHL